MLRTDPFSTPPRVGAVPFDSQRRVQCTTYAFRARWTRLRFWKSDLAISRSAFSGAVTRTRSSRRAHVDKNGALAQLCFRFAAKRGCLTSPRTPKRISGRCPSFN